MFWLRTGTISLVQGNKNAVATGVSFIGEVKPGEILMVGGVLSEIERVVNATTIQLTVAWAGASVSNQPYAVIRNITGASNFDLMKNIEAFLTDRQRSMDEFVEWVNGAYDAGVNSNGTFPMTDRYGVTLSVKSPPRLKWESDQLVSSLTAALATTNAQLTAIGNQTTWANQILGYKTEAIAARDKAQKWAEELVDVAVEAGKYSAKHHATKAAASLADVLTRQSDIVTRQADVTTRQADVTTRQADVTTKQADVTARQTNVISLEASTLANKNSSTTNAATATTKAAEAVTSASQSVAARDTAEKWASEADNVVVLAGKYSAKHYAGKALLSETAAATSKTDAEAAKVLAQTAKTGADTAKTGADTAKTLADGSKTAAQAAKTAAETAQAAAEAARDIAVSSAAAVTGGLVDLGQVSLAGGVYPTKPATYSSFWKVTTAGTVAAIPYGIGDTLVYSKTMDEFYKIDNTESVSSINGETGAVILEDKLGAPLASAATVTIGTAGAGESRHITGALAISSLGVSVTGVKRTLIFDAGLTLIHNATSLVCPGAVDLSTVAGMTVSVICENGASGYWRVIGITHPNISPTELSFLDGVTSGIQAQISSKEPSITAGTSAQVFAGNKTWMSFKPAVLATDLLGLSLASASPITGTDTIISGLGKLQKQISDANTTIGTKQDSLGYTPVQQGTGAGQGTNTVRVGWSASGLLLHIDATDFANSWPISISKNAATATKLATARTINGVPFDGTANIDVGGAYDPGDLIEAGRYIDFHSVANGYDYDVRFDVVAGAAQGQGSLNIYGQRLNLGNTSGTPGTLILKGNQATYDYGAVHDSNGAFNISRYTKAGSWDASLFYMNSSGAATFAGGVTATSFTGPLTGNASSATKLATARAINGVAFDGTADISIAAGETGRLPLAGGTMTGGLISSATNSTMAQSDVTSSIQVRNNSGTGDSGLAMMSFLAQGTYGIKMGIRADGYFGIGGWSRAAWSWYTDPSGNMVAAGNVTAYSDPRLKENFKRVENPFGILNALDGGTFDWKHGYAHTECKAGKHDYGILADQVNSVMPEIVGKSIEIEGESYLTVDYSKIVPVLIEAIKELKAEIEELKRSL